MGGDVPVSGRRSQSRTTGNFFDLSAARQWLSKIKKVVESGDPGWSKRRRSAYQFVTLCDALQKWPREFGPRSSTLLLLAVEDGVTLAPAASDALLLIRLLGLARNRERESVMARAVEAVVDHHWLIEEVIATGLKKSAKILTADKRGPNNLRTAEKPYCLGRFELDGPNMSALRKGKPFHASLPALRR